MFGTVDMSGQHLNGPSEHDECYSLYVSLSLFLSDECLKNEHMICFLSSYCATQMLHINSGSFIVCSSSGRAVWKQASRPRGFVSCTMFVMEVDVVFQEALGLESLLGPFNLTVGIPSWSRCVVKVISAVFSSTFRWKRLSLERERGWCFL